MDGNKMTMREALVIAKTAICHHALVNHTCNSLAWENDTTNANCCNILCGHRDLCEAKTAIQKALSAPARNQEVLAAPIDLNERFIHIGDSVHMLNTSHDGDHEWDDVVLSLEYIGKGGGDDWLVHGEDGAAWACECEVLNGR